MNFAGVTKEQVVKKMMPPHNQSVAQISRDTGVAVPTLYSWKNAFATQDLSSQQSLHAKMTGTPKPSWPPSFRRLP
ncbi:hypothetical protein B9Z50_05620 [Limnohabitans sp. Bal53]|nr:hypothetical protein B9Z50_05620 [Limnohabitans sp. Bal53]